MRCSGSLVILACVSTACAAAPPKTATYGITSSPPSSGTQATTAAPSDIPAAPASPPEAVAAPQPATPTEGASPTLDELWRDTFHNVPSNDVLRAMRATQAKVQRCVHESQARDPEASGEVKIKFIISEDGKVLAWKDDASTMSDEDMTRCLGDVVANVKFPTQKVPGNSVGLYTLQLSK